jgi:small subunit ribosomal protein S4
MILTPNETDNKNRSQQHQEQRMARNTQPRGKISRRLGIPLSQITGKPVDKDPYARRPYPPGQHGAVVKRAISEFAVRLREKQRMRFHYELMEKQSRRYMEEARRAAGNTPLALVRLLESRLDVTVFRAGLASSLRQARQFVRHGHFRVDGERVDLPSYRVRPGQQIAAVPGREKHPTFMEARETGAQRGSVAYLEVVREKGEVKVLRRPELDEVPVQLDYGLIVEYYAQRL